MTSLPDPEAALSGLPSALASLLDAVGVGVAVVGPTGRILVENEALRRFIDCAGEELHRVHRRLLSEWSEGVAAIESFDVVMNGGGMTCIEKRYARADGTVMWGRLAMTIVPDSLGRPRLAVAVCNDVTRARELEQRLKSVAAVVAEWVPPRARRAPDDALSARLKDLSRREAEIVRLLVANRRVASIAKSLGLTPRTVRNHLVSAYRKLGVHSQQALLDLVNGDEPAAGTALPASRAADNASAD